MDKRDLQNRYLCIDLICLVLRDIHLLNGAMFLNLSKCYLYIIYVRINNVLGCGVENENSENSFASARGTGNNVDDDFYDYPKII